MSFVVGTSLLAIVTALVCALPGTFIVLRQSSMLVDAMSHAILPGIVVGYYVTHDFDSPLLIIGAAVAGLIVVLGNDWLMRSGFVSGDAPQGLVFPMLFSIGVILISLNFGNIHLDTHMVLAGDLNFAAWHQLMIGGVSYGPIYMYVLLIVLALNAIAMWFMYPRLKITSFDPTFSSTIGIRARVVDTAFMFLVAVTVTAAFNAAGAILIVALMIAPAATARLVSNSMSHMMIWTMGVAVAGAIIGFWIAYVVHAPTSAAMAVCYGLTFIVILVTTKKRSALRRTNPDRTQRADA
ncbi:metal ABC transporter permease [Arcanobacterium haemolyticum]|uniref:ABC-3 protein n=1 Tax=Arcanobacterium haemolyticum (strain ATCC 9345 / DSM 20595 / CCM 5947 / CCUG 17215 / LMG 16163 / NBRC 15585 / NCTC 8452 / 11018) TaxID=644284 RepID=D7BLV9_ARCHD|nr:metal ABC transporter permease [Arcanobacterium haemolyticum]ADH91908.1 ABC-3 protein [Arcanobacterium haemolyticum DSM 20595]QCX46092.1 metal ABC transporter permease [Arcanobacterium haemolyticum]SQH27000.1 Manganese transport system membrane protein mntB [Arcanobacterium haemolyticum]